MPIQAVVKANNALKGFFSKQKLQIVNQLDSSLSDLAQEFDRAEEALSELKQTAIKRRKQLEEEHILIRKQQTLLRQKIDSLMETVKSQQQEINRLNKTLADANTQVTSIAEKAVSQKYITQSPTTERSGNT